MERNRKNKETEQLATRKVQKPGREKSRSDQLIEQFLELGHPLGIKLTVLFDILFCCQLLDTIKNFTAFCCTHE